MPFPAAYFAHTGFHEADIRISSGGGDEDQGGGVHAVAQSRRLRTVIEDVAEVRVAFAAQDFGALHEERSIANGANVLGSYWRPEARPSGVRIELGT